VKLPGQKRLEICKETVGEMGKLGEWILGKRKTRTAKLTKGKSTFPKAWQRMRSGKATKRRTQKVKKMGRGKQAQKLNWARHQNGK